VDFRLTIRGVVGACERVATEGEDDEEGDDTEEVGTSVFTAASVT
jgi:hypothetical protein